MPGWLPRPQLTLELRIPAYVGRHHETNLPGLRHQPKANVLHPAVIADDGQVVGVAALNLGDGIFGNSTQAKTARCNGHATASPFSAVV